MKHDMLKIKERLVNLLISGYYTSTPKPLQEMYLEEGLEPDTLYWLDVDYSEKPAASYSAFVHYGRILEAIYHDGVKRLYEDAAWREQLLKLTRYWLKNDFCSKGWFHNQLGNPGGMANLMLLLEPWLADDMKRLMLERISRGSLKQPPIEKQTYFKRHEPLEWTGANLIWGATITIKHAVLSEDQELLERAVEWLGTALTYGEEGIQPDGAFCQHGPRWYSCGYGASFTIEITPLIYCLQGTQYAFPEDKLNAFLCHILDGQRSFQHRGYYDYGSVGRQLSRPDNLSAQRLTKAVELLSGMDTVPRKEELKEFLAELRDKEVKDKGTKYYDSICLLQHSSRGGYISIRGSRPDIYGAEQTNNEGWLCYNMSYGTHTCLMRSGREYYNLSPVWDFAKIPGTTARQENDEQLKQHGDWDILFRKENDCKCLVEEDRGVMSQKVEHDGLSLKIAYFVFDGCLAVLGTDILDMAQGTGEVLTTVEQSRASDARIITEHEIINSGWRYTNLDKTTCFDCKVGPVTGSWSRNNPPQSELPVTEEMFVLTVPLEKGNYSYAYSVTPEKDLHSIEVVCNDAICQAILVDQSILMAVVHEDVQIHICENSVQLRAGEVKIVEIH